MSKYIRKTKDCSRCGKRKNIEKDFYRASRAQCKDCERIGARYRMGRPENKIRIALRDSKKVARQYGCYDDLTYDDVAYTFAMAGNRCAYCGDLSNKLQLEHICPLSRNGQNTLSNVTTSCNSCNQRKKTTAILSYADLNVKDTDLILSLLDRMAFRMDVSRAEVIELLRTQQEDYLREDLTEYFERRKVANE